MYRLHCLWAAWTTTTVLWSIPILNLIFRTKLCLIPLTVYLDASLNSGRHLWDNSINDSLRVIDNMWLIAWIDYKNNSVYYNRSDKSHWLSYIQSRLCIVSKNPLHIARLKSFITWSKIAHLVQIFVASACYFVLPKACIHAQNSMLREQIDFLMFGDTCNYHWVIFRDRKSVV